MSRWIVIKIGGNQYDCHDLPGEIIGEFDGIENLPIPERYDYELGNGGPDWYEWWAYELGGGKRTLRYLHASRYKDAKWQKDAWCENGDFDRIVRDDTP